MTGILGIGRLAGVDGEAILSPWSSRVCASALLFGLICSPACLTLLFKIVRRRTERKEPFQPEMQMGPSQTHLPLTLNAAFHSDHAARGTAQQNSPATWVEKAQQRGRVWGGPRGGLPRLLKDPETKSSRVQIADVSMSQHC